MTVDELIAKLQEMPQDSTVVVWKDKHNAFDGVSKIERRYLGWIFMSEISFYGDTDAGNPYGMDCVVIE